MMTACGGRFGAVVLAGVLLIACGGSDENEDTTSAGGSGGAGKGGTAGTGGVDGGGAAGAAGAGAGGVAGSVDGFEVGIAVTDITPSDADIATGQLFMGAYGIVQTRGAATGIMDKVYARSMAVHSGTQAVVMTSLDLPGMSNRFVKEVGTKAAAQTGLPREAILVGATHSHSAPDFQGLWGHVPDDYRQRVIDLTVETIVKAWQARVPATLRVSKGTAENSNRRDWPETDKEMIVLDAHAVGGERLGTLIQFAAHPTKLGQGNLLISRDWCGATVDRVEAETGKPAMYFNGIMGDVSAAGGDLTEYGNMVGDAAIAAMAQQTDITPGLIRENLAFDHAVTNPAMKVLNDLGYLDYDIADVNGQLGISTQAGYMRFGTQVQVVVFPGECLTRLGLAIKDKMTAPFRMWLGLTTDSLGYFLPHDEWRTGHNGNYEETVSIDEFVGEHVREVVVPELEADSTF